MTLSAILVYFSYAQFVIGEITSNYKGFFAVILSAIFFHMSANSISEYRDYVKGVDSKESKGASKLPLEYIKNKQIVYYLGMICFAAATISGLFAVYFVGKILFIPGILVGILVLSYSEWPFRYKYRALGEVSVFFIYGPILGYSCFCALCGCVKWPDLMISIPVGFLVSCVMLANNIRDYKFDLSISNKTLPTVLGLKAAYCILFSIANISYFIVLFIKGVNLWLVFISYPIIFLSIKYVNKHEFFNVFLALQFSFCLVFSLTVLLF